jgi:hypothetical protein
MVDGKRPLSSKRCTKKICQNPFRRVTMRADAGSLDLDALFFLSAETVDSL